jgi:hypothetical protein
MAFETVGVRAVIEGVQAFRRGAKQVQDGIDDIGKQSKLTDKEIQQLSSGLKTVGIALSAVAAAGSAFLYSATRLAARVETLGVVTATLGKNVGYTEDEIRDLEQAIKAQGITLQASRGAIALMIQASIDLAHATDLARLAQDAAVIANLNSSETFERLVWVISAGNVRMARTLGLQVSFEQAYAKTAETLGKNINELTEYEKVQARTNAVLDAGVNITGAYTAAMETAGKKVLSLDRHIEESRRILGEAYLPVFADVVDAVTAGLEKFEEMDSVQQRQISMILASITAWSGLGGVLALGGAALLKAKKAFELLNIAMKAGVVSFGAVFAVIGAAVTIIATMNAKVKESRRLFDLEEEEIRKTADSYEKYVQQVTEAAEANGLIVISQEKYNRMSPRAQAAIDANKGSIVLLTEAQWKNRRELELSTGELYKLYEAYREAEQATDDLGATTEELEEKLSALKLTIQTDIGAQFVDYKEKIADLTSQIDVLEAQEYLTAEQESDLAKLQEELKKTEQAWDQTTKEIIFDLAEQRLAIGGFTEEEISALQRLAGPEGLGLVDEAGAALIEKIDLVASAMDAAGDQSGIFAEDMAALQAMMLDPTISAEELATAIKKIKSKSVTVQTTYKTVRITEYRSSGGSTKRQFGGFVQAGRSALIGEEGPEIFVPRQSGKILNNRFVGAINVLAAAIKAAPALAASTSPAASIAAPTTNNYYYTQHVNTNAQASSVIGDFRSLESLAGAL